MFVTHTLGLKAVGNRASVECFLRDIAAGTLAFTIQDKIEDSLVKDSFLHAAEGATIYS